MVRLSATEIRFIQEEVARQDIHLRHLAIELTDHLCCETEALMDQGHSFRDAFHKVLEIIGKDGLQQIQKDTLFLTDKQYRLMKNSVKIAGVAGMALLAFGALLKIQHLPGASVLMVTGFFLLGFIFFPVSMMVLRKESQQPGRSLLYLTATAGGLAVIFAVMLKVMHWPGAIPLFTAGYGILGLGFLPLLLFSLLKQTPDKGLRITYIIGMLSLFFCLAGGCAKFGHYPGALALLIIGSVGLTSVFYPLYSLKEFTRSGKTEPQFILLSIGILFFDLFNLLLAYR